MRMSCSKAIISDVKALFSPFLSIKPFAAQHLLEKICGQGSHAAPFFHEASIESDQSLTLHSDDR